MKPATDICILFIDDEPNNLISFKASFRYDYTIVLAKNANEAMSILDENKQISIIFSDQRMPGKTGVEFFEEVRRKYPEPMRILITGYADIESVIGAINQGHVFRYIKKPWDEADIHQTVDEAYKFYLTNSLLKKKNEALEKAYQELDRFAYSTSHDIRGPILSVLGIIGLLKNLSLPPEGVNMIGMIENTMLNLDEYIKGLHEHYSTRRGELHFIAIPVKALIEDIRAFFEPVAALRKVTFNVESEGSETFRSDLTSIKIILTNLLSNAFKYQRKTAVEKRVSLHIKASDDQAIFTVSDNGMGIPDTNRENIFHIFFRGTHEEQGSGFGLYNVKDILDKLNGTIAFSSKENEGSTFIVKIPST